MKINPTVKTAWSLGLLLGVLGVGAVGVAAYLRRQEQTVIPAPGYVPTTSVTPPVNALPAPTQGIAAGEPVPGSATNAAILNGFLLAGNAPAPAPSVGTPGTAPLQQIGGSGLLTDKWSWLGHPVRPGENFLGGSPGFDERGNGKEFYA